MHYLDFEKDLEQLDKSLEELKHPFNEEGVLSTIDNTQIHELERKIKTKIDEIYSNLDGWKKTKIARHESRPKAEFYISSIFDFIFWPRENSKYTTDRSCRDLQLHADRLLKSAKHCKLSYMAQSTSPCRKNFSLNRLRIYFLYY